MNDPAAPHAPQPDRPARVVKGPWKDQVSDARQLWRRLGEDELLRCEGHLQKLTQLVQQRYELSRYTAETQVQGFLDRWKRGESPGGTTGQ
ncbi:general stress protein CsbD [Solimonas sp. K1W22B-7]|uniref:CsbD family protein n=1 Tax=Solimonas sp. K1W22B-7 TaxID=2303331 RepID=UPI000E335C4F|nr:general stress protein CsbD [Solimonas sp. K1W22B-7]AXQ27741.1 general stress protein CsbD [Solimonas sp. K1W22B-7]